MKCHESIFLITVATVLRVDVASSACESTNVDIVAWFPSRFQYTEGINDGLCPSNTLNLVYEAAAKQELVPFVEYDVDLDYISPTRLPLMIANRSAKTLCFVTHGYEGSFATEFYDSDEARIAARGGYSYSYLTDGEVVYFDQDSVAVTAYGIVLQPDGIRAHFEPGMDTDAIIYAGYCGSGESADKWGDPSLAFASRTFVGYPGECGNVIENCYNLETLMKNIGCLDSGNRVSSIGASMDDLRCMCGPIYADGEYYNKLNCAKGCDQEPSWVSIDLDDEKLTWSAIEETPSLQYLVRGYRSHDAAPDTIAVLAAGGDGREGVPSYSVPVSLDWAEVDIVARHPVGWTETTARERRWDSRQPWPILQSEPAVKRAAVGRVQQTSAQRPIPQDDPLVPPCPDCNDIIVYTEDADLLGAQGEVVSHYANLQNEHGIANRVRVIVGSADLTTVSAALEVQAEANFAWNADCHAPDCNHKFESPPYLVVLGNSSVVYPPEFPDDDQETCQAFGCSSYYDVTDFDNDGRPDCPVEVIPAELFEEVELVLNAAGDWNDGQYVNPRLAVFCSDEVANGESATGRKDRAWEIAETYGLAGYPALPVLFETEVAPEDWEAAGIETINAGIRDLWIFGVYTTPIRMTRFMSGIETYPMELLTTQQRICVWSPGCFTAATVREWSWGYESMMRQLMLNDPDGTQAVSVVGLMNSDWDMRHEAVAAQLLSAAASASPGVPISKVVWEFVRSLPEELRRYGRGIVVAGAHAFTRDDSNPATAPDVATYEPDEAPVLRFVNPLSSNSSIAFEISKPGRVHVELFDVSGRSVSTLFDADCVAGSLEVTLNEVPKAGVYFIRLTAFGVQAESKAIIFR